MSPDFAIVGAGVIGCGIARELARAGGGRILVIDRGQPGAEASNAAAGLLAVASTRAPRGVVFELRRASAALFPALSNELREESGVDVEYSRAGLLEVAFTPQEAQQLTQLVARRNAQGFAAEMIEPRTACHREPTLNPAVQAGAWFPDDRSINNARLVAALHLACLRRGVEFRLDAPLTGVETVNGRVLAIVAGGERISPRHLVLAAGAWSAEIGALLRVKIPVRADRGEMVAVQPTSRLNNSLCWSDGYLIPRSSGEVLIGSTSARGEMEKTVAAASVALLLRRAVRIVPALSEATLLRSWAGLRPLSTLRRPIIGPLRGYENVTLATGHHRSGILLAPITAKLVAELLLQGETSIPLHPFCYRPR